MLRSGKQNKLLKVKAQNASFISNTSPDVFTNLICSNIVIKQNNNVWKSMVATKVVNYKIKLITV